MLSPETLLQNRYRIVRQLGQGGMGAVYEAVDLRLDTIVALKETLFAEERLRKQFEREARLLARLQHQALPRVSDHFTEADGQFLVMQFVAGEDLSEMLAERKAPFSPEEVLHWGDQLCDALDYLHTQDPQIVHRDIKPQNLKLTARGQVILLDFGLAKGYAGQMSVVTSSVSIFGYTPNYAPLEQVQAQGTDARSDLYALAATLYHLMTNVRPPDALSRAAAMVNGLPDPLQSANTLAPNVTPTVAAVLNVAMAQKRDNRYATAADMRKALSAAARGEAAEADTVMAYAGAPTVAAGEAKTKLQADQDTALRSEAATMLTGGAHPQTGTVAQTGTMAQTLTPETVTAVAPSPPVKRRFAAWQMIAAAAIVVIGCAGAFYAFRARQRAAAPQSQSQPAASEAARQPEARAADTNTATTAPAAGEGSEVRPGSKAETKAEKQKDAAEPNQRAAAKPSTEKNVEPPKSGQEEGATHDAEHRDDRKPPPGGPPPPLGPRGPFRNQRPPGPGSEQVQGDGAKVRTLPNGTRIVTRPDGTRIVITPDGTTHVFTPGQKGVRKTVNRP
jgi:predicted Ser/Thr protein kinase